MSNIFCYMLRKYSYIYKLSDLSVASVCSHSDSSFMLFSFLKILYFGSCWNDSVCLWCYFQLPGTVMYVTLVDIQYYCICLLTYLQFVY